MDKQKDSAINFAKWIAEKMANDSWFRFSDKWDKWYIHTVGWLTHEELFEYYSNNKP